ncbi:WGR domain-containing protein [Nostoc sp. WHI]|uniref:WGR domain-containing protein n=1 Tax=Nostoc sp. WHI TaxID=2650611 RepID=UPI0018C461E0|nr:WGR domain-containing protein [Nostoc sp. WHI]MBG1265530.1 WGR domain-containing protein [Nostoc sp. WHI]MBG1270106.1 WGR domain-containing protein [Nostoc sp. WHI]
MEIYLVFVDAIQNSNKFWAAIVEDGNLTVQWGRVGYQAQTKVHSLANHQRAVAKFHNLVAEKMMKGYSESQPQMDGDRSISDIRRAIQLLNAIRLAVANRNFGNSYILALNEYLKIVPTPLGMQIDPYRVYRTVVDVDYQQELLKSLLVNEPVAVQTKESPKSEPKTVSLKAISKNFWRHL